MQYSIEMDIQLPRSRVIELFDSSENMKKWQPELIRFEHISGEPGQVGAKSNLLYKMGRREVEMVETVTNRALPDQFDGTYEADGVWNEIKNTFVEVDESTTHWILSSEFQCSTLFMKIFAAISPGSFKKQTLKFMNRFREFAENGGLSPVASSESEVS